MAASQALGPRKSDTVEARQPENNISAGRRDGNEYLRPLWAKQPVPRTINNLKRRMREKTEKRIASFCVTDCDE